VRPNRDPGGARVVAAILLLGVAGVLVLGAVALYSVTGSNALLQMLYATPPLFVAGIALVLGWPPRRTKGDQHA
jgi:hypothetical protein